MSSAQIDEPPSPSKLALIRRFLKASGVQQRIDAGGFLERYSAVPGSPLMVLAGRDGASLIRAMTRAREALNAAYAKHRHVWQEEYESHVNWEYTETELGVITAFLESAVGQHFMEGRWRMDAYIETNTSDLTEAIVEEAGRAISG